KMAAVPDMLAWWKEAGIVEGRRVEGDVMGCFAPTIEQLAAAARAELPLAPFAGKIDGRYALDIGKLISSDAGKCLHWCTAGPLADAAMAIAAVIGFAGHPVAQRAAVAPTLGHAPPLPCLWHSAAPSPFQS